jgi:hypothetical protein
MSRAALLFVVPVILACAKKEAPPVDTSAMTAAPETTALTAPVNYAGSWTVTVMPEAKDTVLLTYAFESTNDTTGWKITFPGRPTMEPRVVSMDNDSVVLDNGPYSSVLRKNVMVTTHSSMHMEGDKLVGRTIAHYSNTRSADSVVVLRTEATRK